MMVTSVLADKLDTDVVNGLQDDDLDWDAIYWRPVEDDVRRLRQRIFKASQDRGPQAGPQPAEVDAAEPVEHACQRAAGDAAQRWSQDGGHRW